jgi:hypothetical protein
MDTFFVRKQIVTGAVLLAMLELGAVVVKALVR